MNKKIAFHVKIGDRIKIISGSNKGIIGTIKSINVKNLTVFVDSVTSRVRFIKNKQGGEAQKAELETPIHISNVMLWDAKANLCSRIGYKILDGEKKRFFKKSGNFV